MIWGSILGAAPFTLMLPYAGLTGTIVLAVIIGLIISSAFSAIVVYATDLMPGQVGMIAGIFFGLMFGSADSARPSSAGWPTGPASNSSSGSALCCPCWASSQAFYPT